MKATHSLTSEILLAGDITRQLNHLGYKVSYHQKTLDEYAFCVSNLATDLKDGACLV